MKNTFNKLSLLSFFRGCFVCRVRYCLYPVYIFALLAVFNYCFIESSFAEIGDGGVKLNSSALDVRDSFFDSNINILVPKSFNGDNSFKLGQNCTLEFVRSGVESCFLVSSISDVSTKNSDKYAANNFFKVVYEKFNQRLHSPFDWFWWFVILPLCLMPIWISWLFPRFYSS